MKAFLIFLANIKPLIQEGKILYDDAVKLYRKNFNKDPEGIEALQLRKEFSKAAEGEKVIPIAPRLPKEAPYSEKNPSGWMPTAEEESGIMSRLKGQIDDLKEQASKYEDMSVSDFMSDYFNMPKSKTPVTDKIQKQLGDVKLFGDETFEELQIIKETGKHPRNKADGGRIGYATGAGVKAYRGIKALMDKVNKRFGKGTIKTAEEIDRPEKAKLKEMFDAFNERLKKKTRPSRKEYERLKDEEPEIMAEYDEMWSDEGPVQMSMEDLVEFRTLKPAGQGRFTKAEAIRARLENTIKEAKPEDEDYDWVMETFPKWIDEIEKNPSLADNETVWKELGMTGMPSNQRFKIYDDGTVDFETKKFRLKEEIKRKLNASGGLNYLMGL